MLILLLYLFMYLLFEFKQHGGLGKLSYPLLSDYNKEIAKAYDVLIEPDGIPLRGLFIIDPKVNNIKHISI